MSNDDFEKRLRDQIFRAPAAGVRQRILRAAGEREPQTVVLPIVTWWRALLWPAPGAWAGLAAVWVCILILNRDAEPEHIRTADNISSPAQQFASARRERNQLFAELMNDMPSDATADRPKATPPRPRSEAAKAFVCV